MKIRQAKLSDIVALATLMRVVIGNTPYYTAQACREEIKKHNKQALKQYLSDKKYYTCIVALEEKEIIGFVIGRNEAGVFWLDWVGVHKDFRGRKVARILLREIEKKIKQQGVHKIWCDTRDTNKESISLISKLNYKKLGIFRNGWYKQDFLLWEKDIQK